MPKEEARRSFVRKARRIVVKVGSSSLTTSTGALDARQLFDLVTAIVDARAAGHEVVLVSSGAIAAGLAPLSMRQRPHDLASQQACAAVGQRILIEKYGTMFGFFGIDVGQILLTVDDVTRETSYRNALRTFNRLLELGVLPIVNENDTVATQEIRFGDNDRLAALVAHAIGADVLFLLSDVDGLYTEHPSNPEARLIPEVRSIDALHVDVSQKGAAVGTGGMTTKLDAARVSTSAGVTVVLTAASKVKAALAGEPVGTVFYPTGKRRPHRLLWLAHISESQGSVELDEGAVRAVATRNASLLAAGITGVSGDFHAGDPISLVDGDGRVLAHGFTRYDASAVAAMKGKSSAMLLEQMGSDYIKPVVHRDSLIVKKAYIKQHFGDDYNQQSTPGTPCQ